MKPRLLDLFCGAGGAGMGYRLAGFNVTGVDNRPQKRYPLEFICADALEYLRECGHSFDVIHASPPCQGNTHLRSMWPDREYEDLIPATRDLLLALGKPYVIENVEGAILRFPARLCGTSFGLGTGDAELRRHRLFETNWPLLCPPCAHGARFQSISVNGIGNALRGRAVISIFGGGGADRRYSKPSTDKRPACVTGNGHTGGRITRTGRRLFSTEECREAMGIDWMTGVELSQAIPPAYTRYIGEQLMELIR